MTDAEAKLAPKRLILMILIVLATALSGCAGIPTPVLTSGGPTAAPTSRPGLGSIRGRLVIEASGQPYVATLYLARAIRASQAGASPLIALSEQTDPKASQDPSTGGFEFGDVAPGSYVLVIWTPVGNTVVERAGTQEYLPVDVGADQVLDLGVVPVR